MNGTIAIGTYVITIDTAYKASVVSLLTGILVTLGSIAHWLTT